MEENIKKWLEEKDNISKKLKEAMTFANLSVEDLADIFEFTNSKTKEDLLYEVEKIIEEGGV